jgi:replication-associated recombination protein RarA
MKTEIIEKIFNDIEEGLKTEFIGQDSHFHEVCKYFEKKIIKDKRGVLLVAGDTNTFKKMSLRYVFSKLKDKGILENGIIDIVNLASYDFTFGYNSFLTDLNDAMNNDSDGLILCNLEKASSQMLELISKIKPGSKIQLPKTYSMKNRIFIESSENENSVDSLNCMDKHIMMVYNKEVDGDCEDFIENNIQKRDKVLFTRNLTANEKTELIKKLVLKVLKEIEVEYNMDITFRNKDSEKVEAEHGIVHHINEFHESGNFTSIDYVRYKIGIPLRNILKKSGADKGGRILLYVEDERIYAKINDGIYKLKEYANLSLDEVKHRLDTLVGMKDFKEYLTNIENNFKVQKIRERLGMETVKMSLNMVFLGNAGSGKTNAARITFDYLNALGLLSRDVFLEVSKSDFVPGEHGDVLETTNHIIESSLGGVLFIDEAYSLLEDGNDKEGREIIDTLLTAIENNRGNLVVILAGYENEMDKLFSINQGLKSRFQNTVNFRDYTPEEMYEIAVQIAGQKGYFIAENVKNDLIDLFTRNQIIEKNGLGNARFVRNIIENAIMDASRKYLLDPGRQIDVLYSSNFNFNAKVRFDLEEKLESIIGLNEVKSLLRDQFRLLKAQEKRKSVGVETEIEQNLNMVFAGNPGTGKTSIARLVAEMLNSMGFLKGGQLVETDRSNFVSEKPGQTPAKTEETFMKAIGGILFIDEAYTLASDSLGREAIETLLKLIEDYSRDVIVILAGYSQEMEDFFDVNIGLRSRFPLWTNFEDYNPGELMGIAVRLLESKGFTLSSNAEKELERSFVDIYDNGDVQSGNARMVRNHVENLIRVQSGRIADEVTSEYEMNQIVSKDVKRLVSAEKDNSFNLEKKLEEISGNDNAKEFLKEQYKLFMISEKRKRFNMDSDINKYRNFIFSGDMGTGKGIILDTLAEMMFSIGAAKAKLPYELHKNEIMNFIDKGKSLEDILNKGIGKVIFIHKADLLVHEKNADALVVDLIKFIDKNRNRLILVIEGEEKPIKDMMKKYPALGYRFPVMVNFESYSERALLDLAVKIFLEKGYELDVECRRELTEAVFALDAMKDMILKNGLMVKQLVDNIARAQSVRAYDLKLDKDAMNRVDVDDIRKGSEKFIRKNA